MGCSKRVYVPKLVPVETHSFREEKIVPTITTAPFPIFDLSRVTKDTTSTLENALVKSTATWSNNELTHTLISKVDSIKLKVLVKEVTIRDSIPVPYPVEVVIPHTKTEIFFEHSGKILWGILLLFILIRYGKNLIKLFI